MPRHVLDIFLSSTSEDLQEYRATVTDVLSRLGQFVVRMETFGAKPNKPWRTCRNEVGRADALIVLVGHRYGWIPSKREGGDGQRSITWWEVQWALDQGKPVYAFLIDPRELWRGSREQDRLIATTSESETLRIGRAVRGLQSFRAFLGTHATRELFRTADQLGSLVAKPLSVAFGARCTFSNSDFRGPKIDRIPAGNVVSVPPGSRSPTARRDVLAGTDTRTQRARARGQCCTSARGDHWWPSTAGASCSV
jgi:hypothetical protein